MSGAVRISVGAVVTGLTLAALAVAPASATGSANPYIYWHLTYQAHRNTDNTVISVAAASRHDYWAIDQASSATSNSVLRWTGHSWHSAALPGGFEPVAVTALAPHDVWLSGYASRTSSSPMALHWNGSRWSRITMPMPAVITQYNPLTVLGPRDVWVTGHSTWTRAAGWHSMLWHWNGTRWRSYRLPVVLSFDPIAGSSDRNLWAFGEATRSDGQIARGKLMTYRWRGDRWQVVAQLRRRITEPPEVAMARSGRIWLVTRAAKPTTYGYPTELFRRSGGSWSQLSTGGLQLGQPEPDGLGDAWFGGIIYYTGVGVSWLAGNATDISGCAGGLDPVSAAAGIPGSHSVLIGGWCMPRKNGRYQGLIMISKPQ